MNKFWDRVDSLRELQGISQNRFAEKIGKSLRTVEDWKRRKYIPTGDICLLIAQLFLTTTEFLITGEEITLPDDDFAKEKPVEPIQSPNGRTFIPHYNEEPTLLVPIAPQRVSAGPGQEFLPPSEYIGYVRILERMARGIDPTSLVAVSVKGDSMTGVQIFEGDMVLFAQHHISENGIYVISLYGDLKVKRLEFRSGEQKIFIHSENSRYSTEEILMTNENLMILGKVVGWVHCHPY
ncbi:LexA family transcriptional regulator [Sphaerochaeta pleomorpha]|nr:LexA family transcriptional regulator [Sphaerochaeta pleomorpha]